MIISNSPDINLLLVQVTWDISGATPVIELQNLSTGSNLAGCTWAFSAFSPSETPIHDGNINQPDITGNWSTHNLNDAWPKPFNSIEWSGSPYQFFVTVKDSQGNIFINPVQDAFICHPAGNTNSSKNTYGVAKSDVQVQCNQAAVFFQDTTYHTYKGTDGTQISSVLRVIYPIDETLTIPTPFVAAAYSTALVPISYSSPNYQFVQTQVYDYDLGDNTIVRIKYQSIYTFGVFCNYDLEPLVCEITKLIDTIETGNCSDIAEAQRKMNLIVSKFTLVMIGIQQPLTGVNVPLLIEEIIAIGGFNCNCCTAATGIIPNTSSVIGNYNFTVNKLGGDINGSWTTNGNNITLNLGDVAYVVAIGNESPSTISAFSVTPVVSGDGFLKTYYINIDGTQLAYDILNVIKDNTALINLFNSIVNANLGDLTLNVDTNCLGINSGSCDFQFTLVNIPASPNNAILKGIQVGQFTRTINYAFNLSTLGALQAYLNTLSLGAFVVSTTGGGTVIISSTGNTFPLAGMLYNNTVGSDRFAAFSSECSGFTPISANLVVQAIIDYLCGITDSQMITSQDYVICSIDPVSKAKVLTTVTAGSKENILISQLLDKNCDTTDYILGIQGVNCNSMKSLFASNINLLQNTDILLGTKGGDCAGISPVEAATRMFQLGAYNADFMEAFCNLVSLCAGGFSCDPYTIFQVAVIDGSPSATKMDIVVTFTHPSAISNTIRYARIDNTNTPVYTTIPNILPGASPYMIANIDEGDYFVGITPIYADGRACSEVSTTTGMCTGITSFSAIINDSGNIVISYSAVEGLPKVKVIINYPNGGTASTIYNNTGTDITITPPAGVYGDYFITMIPVCNEATGFFGQATAPVILGVTPPSNSLLTNNSTSAYTVASLSAKISGGSTLIFSVPSIAASGGTVSFFLADGVYDSILISYGTGSAVGVGNAYLTSSSGTILNVFTANPNAILFDEGFTNVGGIQIVITDGSPV